MDPDVPIRSIESRASIRTPRSSNVYERMQNVKSSPVSTTRARSGTPNSLPVSRSPSVASTRYGRSTPSLEKKASLPNLSSSRSTTPAHQPQFRRQSSNLNPGTPFRPRSVTPATIPERKKMTPSSVAQEYFGRELAEHAKMESRTTVFVHDACYGHRFSRQKSSRATIGSIVERPERIHATLLGASTAYVRLGGRHKAERYYPHPSRNISELAVPFTIRKSRRSIPLNHPAVIHVHGKKWMEELQVMCDLAESRLEAGQKELQRPPGHGKDDKGSKLPELHAGDLYLARESLSALQGCLGAVCDAVDTVFTSPETRRSFVCVRPPGHHCSANMPSGFCWLNNVHVGISYAAMQHGLTHAAIIDFDLHHGDGSQTIAWNHNFRAAELPKSADLHKRVSIGYYSLHDINSYPCEAGDPDKISNASVCIHDAHNQSVWNVHLESFTSHAHFWDIYDRKYKVILQKAEEFLVQQSERLRQQGIEPKAAVFLSAGFDASEYETEHMQRHGVNVPTDFYAKFTADTVQLASKESTGAAGRVISVLEGGYSDRALTSGVLSHLSGLVSLSEPRHASSAIPTLAPIIEPEDFPAYNSEWWSKHNLESLEAKVAGRVLPLLPVASDGKPPGSYSSPTQASISRMTETAQERQSLHAQLERKLWLENAPPEPVPEVDWVVAAYELSRLLIPEDRQTLSCTYEELNEETVRARRDRQSLLAASSSPDEKIQLRERKSKTVATNAKPKAAPKTTNRRTTIASVQDLPDPATSVGKAERPRRRSSAASSVMSSFQDLDTVDTTQGVAVRAPRLKAGPAQSSLPSLPVGRTRVPTKKPASAVNSPRKPRTTAKPAVVSANTNNVSNKSGLEPSLQTSSASDGVDELTSGLKKISIKLKMPSEGQNAVNEQAKSRSKIARKPPVAKPTKELPSVPSPLGPTSQGSTLLSRHTNVEAGVDSAQAGGHANIPSGPTIKLEQSMDPTTLVKEEVRDPAGLPSQVTYPSLQLDHLSGYGP